MTRLTSPDWIDLSALAASMTSVPIVFTSASASLSAKAGVMDKAPATKAAAEMNVFNTINPLFTCARRGAGL